MKLVIDTNIIISALIRKESTRRLILNKNFEFITPAFSLSEIEKHQKEICEKANIDLNQYYTLLDVLFRYIRIINPAAYSEYIVEAKKLITDIDDIPFLACAISFKCPIWSDDKHFRQQEAIKVYSTSEMIREFGL